MIMIHHTGTSQQKLRTIHNTTQEKSSIDTKQHEKHHVSLPMVLKIFSRAMRRNPLYKYISIYACIIIYLFLFLCSYLMHLNFLKHVAMPSCIIENTNFQKEQGPSQHNTSFSGIMQHDGRTWSRNTTATPPTTPAPTSLSDTRNQAVTQRCPPPNPSLTPLTSAITTPQ